MKLDYTKWKRDISLDSVARALYKAHNEVRKLQLRKHKYPEPFHDVGCGFIYPLADLNSLFQKDQKRFFEITDNPKGVWLRSNKLFCTHNSCVIYFGCKDEKINDLTYISKEPISFAIKLIKKLKEERLRELSGDKELLSKYRIQRDGV